MNNKRGNEAFVRLALAFVALFAAGDLCAQSLRVTAANSSADNAVYDVLFNPTGTTLLNSDGTRMGRFRSLVFVPGITSGVDLIVADTAGGNIVRYVAPTGSPLASSVVVWSAASGVAGPQQPDGLSVDSAGNLYVITNKPSPAVWVLPPSSAAPGGFGAPVLLDSKFAGHEVDALVETVVVPSTSVTRGLTGYGISPGDLLVLVADADSDASDKNEGVTVFDYSASSIAAFLASPSTPLAAPAVALKEAQLLVSSKKSAVPLPTGMDIWPVDGSLLLSTTAGSILQYALPAPSTHVWWTKSSATTFATVSPCTSKPCFGKLRTGAQTAQTNGTSTTTAYAFVTQPSGAILEFAGTPPFAAPTASVPTNASAATTGSPEGLTVAPQSVVIAAASTCATTSGCNPTGGLTNAVTNGVTGAGAQGVSGNIIQQSCIVTDTRLQPNGSCPGTINISQACPGFPANIVPPTICGASGPGGNQLAIILSIANGVDDVPGILVQTQADPSGLIPKAISVPCTNHNQVVGWTPRLGSNEGTIPEGANVVDMTTFCDKQGSGTRGNSVWVIGGQLSTAVTSSKRDLVGFADRKLKALGTTIRSGPIADRVQDRLGDCLISSAIQLHTGHYSCAARNIYYCDQLVANNASSFGSSPTDPNVFGDVRGRLGSLFYTINTRIAGNPANTSWPLTSPPPACGDHDYDNDRERQRD